MGTGVIRAYTSTPKPVLYLSENTAKKVLNRAKKVLKQAKTGVKRWILAQKGRKTLRKTAKKRKKMCVF